MTTMLADEKESKTYFSNYSTTFWATFMAASACLYFFFEKFIKTNFITYRSSLKSAYLRSNVFENESICGKLLFSNVLKNICPQ